MSKQMMNSVKMHDGEHGHQYECKIIHNGEIPWYEILTCEKLPPILRALREATGYTFKVPHGNKVRTLILEEGICRIENGDDVYEITVDRW